jgi:hypothetical protein
VTTHRFEAVLGADVGDRPAVVLPADVAAAMGGRARHCVGFRKHTRAAAGGDDAPRTVAVPDDLAAALAAEPGLREAFDAMSYTHRRDWVEAVEGAKRPETRARRISQAVEAARATQ